MDRLVILIPAYNELNNLKKILSNNLNFFIIDDCSNDGTENYLKEKKINYLKNNSKLGYELSLLKGFSYILENFKEINSICTIDGDNEHPVNEIKNIKEYFDYQNLDILICNREKQNRILEKIFSILFKLRYGLKDPLSGMKFYRTSLLENILGKVTSNFFLVDLIYFSIKEKYKLKNYLIRTNQNLKNSKIGHSFRVNLKVVKLLKYLI